MIDRQEAWQVFSPLGEPILGASIIPAESRKTKEVIVGAVHIWVWRKTEKGVEVLLQKRAISKPTWPDHLDISIAGHIDTGESVMDAAIRESKEEVGLTLDASKLEYIFSYRNFQNGLKWVYLYEMKEDIEFTFHDGEVQSIDWVTFDRFVAMIERPEGHKLVPHLPEYYGFVVRALSRFI